MNIFSPSSHAIQIHSSSKLIGTHKYPRLREDIYRSTIHYLDNAINDKKCTKDALIELKITDVLSSEKMKETVNSDEYKQKAMQYLDEMKYAILLNDVTYLKNVACLYDTRIIIEELRIGIFKDSEVINQKNPHSYKSPSQSLRFILLNNNLIYVGAHTASLTPNGKGLFVDLNGCKYCGKFKDGDIASNVPLTVTFSDGIIYQRIFNQGTEPKDVFFCKLLNQRINSNKYNTQDIIDILKNAPRGAKVYLRPNEIIIHYTDYEKYVIPTKLTEAELSSNNNFHEVNNSGMSADKNKKIFCLTDKVYFTDNMENDFQFPGRVDNFKKYLLEEHGMKKIISITANESDHKTEKTSEMVNKYIKLDDFSVYNIENEVQKVEQFAKEESILNCGEFTTLTTQLFIKYLNTLDKETQQKFYNQYELENGELDNGALQKDNHDHIMLFIVDKKTDERVCVIDAWLIAKYPHQIFIGTEDDYFKLLKISIDNKYIKNDISKKHIKTMENYNKMAFKLTIDKFHAVQRCASDDTFNQELQNPSKPNGLWVVSNTLKCYYVMGKVPTRTKVTLVNTNTHGLQKLLSRMAEGERWSNEALRKFVEITEDIKIKYKKPKIIQMHNGKRLNAKTNKR